MDVGAEGRRTRSHTRGLRSDPQEALASGAHVRLDLTQLPDESDHEFLPETGGALIYVTMVRLMLKRLAKGVE